MAEYKKGDKVVIELEDYDVEHLENECAGIYFNKSQLLGKLEDFQPAEEKIKFTVEEKREFDELKNDTVTLLSALAYMSDKQCPKLYSKLFKGNAQISFEEQNKAQLKFARAWEKPSRIEVVEPEKRVIVLGNGLWLQRNTDGFFYINNDDDFDVNFTLDEIKQAEKQLGIQGLQAKWHEGLKEK